MATSILRDTKSETLTATEMKELLNELYPFENYLQWTVSDMLEEIASTLEDEIVEKLIELVAPAVVPAAGLGIAVAEVTTMLQDAMRWEDIYPYLNQMTNNNKRFRITTYYYEWISGSGNHTGYYIEEEYAVI